MSEKEQPNSETIKLMSWSREMIHGVRIVVSFPGPFRINEQSGNEATKTVATFAFVMRTV